MLCHYLKLSFQINHYIEMKAYPFSKRISDSELLVNVQKKNDPAFENYSLKRNFKN